MSEPTSFEVRALLAPKRRRLTRLGLLLPVITLVGITWAGISGAHSNRGTAAIPSATAVAAPAITVAASTPLVIPADVIGLHVRRLDDVQTAAIGRDDIIAVAGWYVATATIDCPPLARIEGQGSPSGSPGDTDHAAYCRRFGVLYASQPDVRGGRSESAALSAVGATIVVGVVMPRELEIIGADPTAVVVIGRLVAPGGGCLVQLACPGELLIDHVAWSASA